MTFAGILAFLGLAVVTMDVLGGVTAPGVLLRGRGGYTVVVTAATLVLLPLLAWRSSVLRPVLDSNNAIGTVEIVVGLALAGISAHQFRAVTRPQQKHGRIEERSTPTRLAATPLALAGVAFSVTALADPSFTIAVGMASQERHLWAHIALLLLWNVVYQLPLVSVTIAAAFGRHEQLVERVMAVYGPRRRALQTALAILLALIGLAVLGDGIYALISGHVPWLRQLIMLR